MSRLHHVLGCLANDRCWATVDGAEYHPGLSYGVYLVNPQTQSITYLVFHAFAGYHSHELAGSHFLLPFPYTERFAFAPCT